MTSHSDWVSAHLFYHEAPAEVIAHVVDPVVHRNASSIDRWFFVRYWAGGPHVRFRFRTADPEQRKRIARDVEGEFLRFVRIAPSRAVLQAHDLASLSSRLVENEPGAAEPLHADNSIAWRSYTGEIERYGGTSGLAAVEDFFTASSRIALLTRTNDGIGTALLHLLIGLLTVSEDTAWLARFLDEGRRHSPAADPAAGRLEESWTQATASTLRVLERARDLARQRTDPWSVACHDLQTNLRSAQRREQLAPVGGIGPDTDVDGRLHRAVVSWSAFHMHTNRLGTHLEKETLVVDLARRALAAKREQ